MKTLKPDEVTVIGVRVLSTGGQKMRFKLSS